MKHISLFPPSSPATPPRHGSQPPDAWMPRIAARGARHHRCSVRATKAVPPLLSHPTRPARASPWGPSATPDTSPPPPSSFDRNPLATSSRRARFGFSRVPGVWPEVSDLRNPQGASGASQARIDMNSTVAVTVDRVGKGRPQLPPTLMKQNGELWPGRIFSVRSSSPCASTLARGRSSVAILGEPLALDALMAEIESVTPPVGFAGHCTVL